MVSYTSAVLDLLTLAEEDVQGCNHERCNRSYIHVYNPKKNPTANCLSSLEQFHAPFGKEKRSSTYCKTLI